MDMRIEHDRAGRGELLREEVCIPNVEKLAAYINSQKEPMRFAKLLIAFCKPSMDNITNRE